MKDLFVSPNEITTDLVVDEDSSFGYFLSDSFEEKKSSLHFSVKKGKHLSLTLVDFTKSDLDIDFVIDLEENSEATLQIASIDSGNFTKIFRGNVNHNGIASTSLTKMAGINSSTGTLRFLGSSYIKNGAHKSSTRQEAKITNLSPDAKSECSPSLLIKENDVKASHGAALGAYDPEMLFYLMSRGISLEESKKLITFGSLLPIIESLEDKDLVTKIKDSLGGLLL